MALYRKKPVVIEAYQYRESEQDGRVCEEAARGDVRYPEDGTMLIRTLEGVMVAQPGDWIIRGVKGELYPCKPDIFEKTYEPVRPHHSEEFSMHDTTSPRPDTDETIEAEIVRKGKTAPRVTPADIENAIFDEAFYVFPGSQLTVCCLTLFNDFTVTGESACADPANFDAGIGKRVARENAKQKIWPLLGYVLKQKLYDEKPIE